MSDSQDTDGAAQPGKTRTWWHPLLARLLDHELSSAFTVQDEVLVGKLPLRVDILLIRRDDGELPETSRRDLSVLIPLLSRYTLIEFKGPTDSLQSGDVAYLFGCVFLWHGQQPERIAPDDISLLLLAPIRKISLMLLHLWPHTPRGQNDLAEAILGLFDTPRAAGRPEAWVRSRSFRVVIQLQQLIQETLIGLLSRVQQR